MQWSKGFIVKKHKYLLFYKVMPGFVQNINGDFSLNGKALRFIGANVYELANLETSITRKIIEESAEMGFRVLRFWLFKNRETSELIKKLNEICDFVKPIGIKLIVSLSDKWGYLQDYKIDEQWYKEGYKNGYLEYVKTLTGECCTRNEIMIWELINEPETDSFDTFYNFAEHVSSEIKSVNTNHLLSTGTVGGVGDKFGSYFSVFRKSNFRKLYSLPALDAVSLHDYSYDASVFERLDVLYRFRGNADRATLYEKIDDVVDVPFDWLDSLYLNRSKLIRVPLTLRAIWNRYNKSDIKFARKLNKPVYIGEVGFKANPKRDRTKILEFDIEQKFKMGVGGYVLWSFESLGWNKDGHSYGFGLNDGYGEVIRKWNRLNES